MGCQRFERVEIRPFPGVAFWYRPLFRAFRKQGTTVKLDSCFERGHVSTRD